MHCQTGLIKNILIANFNPENPGIGMPKSRDFGIGKLAGIPGLINSLHVDLTTVQRYRAACDEVSVIQLL